MPAFFFFSILFVPSNKRSFTVEAQQRGDHSLCFKNDLEGGDAITIGFAFRADGDVETAAALERSGELTQGSSSSPLVRELATEANVKSMIEVANELTQGLDMLADHQVRFFFLFFFFLSVVQQE